MTTKLSLLILFVLVVLPGCKLKPGCLIESKVVDTVSSALSTQLQCAKPELVKQDVQAAVGKLGLCKTPQPTGPIASFACPLIASWAAEKFVGAIPARWECSAQNAKEKAMLLLTTACEALPF